MELVSLQASFPGRSGGGVRKGRKACTSSMEFEYLHLKSKCEILIVYIRACFSITLIGRNLTAQSMGSYRGIGGGIQIPETQLQALLPFPALPPERPRELARRLKVGNNTRSATHSYFHSNHNFCFYSGKSQK